MTVLEHVKWKSLDSTVLRQQSNRSSHTPVISLFRWWARRPHSFAGAILDAAVNEFKTRSFTVADPFSGGGTVAFEAVRRNLPIYAQELYPWASEGLATALTYAPAEEFELAAKTLLESLDSLRKDYQRTEKDDVVWETSHIIRVRTSACVLCSHPVFLYRDPFISLASRNTGEEYGFFGCSACGTANRRRRTVQSFRCTICNVRTKIKDQFDKGRPTVRCQHCCESIELSTLLEGQPTWCSSLLREYSLATSKNLSQIRPVAAGDRVLDIKSSTTESIRVRIPDGIETGHLIKAGLTFWDEIYTQKQITIISTALEMVNHVDTSEPVKQHLRLAILGCTEMAGYLCRWERYHPKALEAIANHRFSRSTVTVETNLLSPSGRGTLPRRLQASAKALRWMKAEGFPARTTLAVSDGRRRAVKAGALIVTGSSERQLLKDGMVRLVFTDPPYHDDLQYGELSRLFHTWLRTKSDGTSPGESSEAVPNTSRGNQLNHYENTVTACLMESHRTLARNGRLVLTFHNKDLKAWEALMAALIRANFMIIALATVSAENPADHCKRGKETFLSDLVIECRPRLTTRRRLQRPKLFGRVNTLERKNLVAIGLAVAHHVNRGVTGNLQPLFLVHLTALKASRILIWRGGRQHGLARCFPVRQGRRG